MSDYTFEAVTAGHICLDVIPDLAGIPPEDFGRLFSPGRLVEVGPVTFSTGGPVSNGQYHDSFSLGLQTGYLFFN